MSSHQLKRPTPGYRRSGKLHLNSASGSSSSAHSSPFVPAESSNALTAIQSGISLESLLAFPISWERYLKSQKEAGIDQSRRSLQLSPSTSAIPPYLRKKSEDNIIIRARNSGRVEESQKKERRNKRHLNSNPSVKSSTQEDLYSYSYSLPSASPSTSSNQLSNISIHHSPPMVRNPSSRNYSSHSHQDEDMTDVHLSRTPSLSHSTNSSPISSFQVLESESEFNHQFQNSPSISYHSTSPTSIHKFSPLTSEESSPFDFKLGLPPSHDFEIPSTPNFQLMDLKEDKDCLGWNSGYSGQDHLPNPFPNLFARDHFKFQGHSSVDSRKEEGTVDSYRSFTSMLFEPL